MTINNKDDYIRYRFSRAMDAHQEALILADNSKWNAVINRLYYACFYAVIALLLKHELDTHTHEGARSQFGLHFIKQGIIDKKFGKLFTKLSDYRQKVDYGDLYDYDYEIAEPLIEEVLAFIRELEKHI